MQREADLAASAAKAKARAEARLVQEQQEAAEAAKAEAEALAKTHQEALAAKKAELRKMAAELEAQQKAAQEAAAAQLEAEKQAAVDAAHAAKVKAELQAAEAKQAEEAAKAEALKMKAELEAVKAASPPPTAAAAPPPPLDDGPVTPAGRFTDFEHVSDEPSPIVGLFLPSNPEVPIDEAVGRMNLDLSAELFTAKRKFAKGAGKALVANVPEMTPDMAAAIYLYTAEAPADAPMYSILNRCASLRPRVGLVSSVRPHAVGSHAVAAILCGCCHRSIAVKVLWARFNFPFVRLLRKTDRTTLKVRFFPYLRLLITGMCKLRAVQKSEKRMVNRGVKLDLVGMFPEDYAKEETLVWWQFSSTTSDIAVLDNPMFLGKSGDRTIFQVLTASAVDVSAFSAVNNEAEMLLPPGVALRVKGILSKSADGLTIIACEDDPDVPPLLK